MNIGKYKLDKEQMKIVEDNHKYLMVVAGAGSGKTLTILGKINYLIKNKNVKNDEILCISFTKEASNSLKNKIKQDLNIDINVYTFHKLSLEIIKNYNIKFHITPTNTLKNIIYEYIYVESLNNKYVKKQIITYFKLKDKREDKYNDLLKDTEKIDKLINIIITFINLFKCNGYDVSKFYKIIKKKKSKYNNNLLLIIFNIYILYESYLKENNEIDFNDMIILATSYYKNTTKFKKIKYIIIDEYQDTSLIRFKLIKEIINVNKANLLVVGDDYQSIYRFTGCDLNLFLKFKKYIKGGKIKKITTTYRNSNELIKVAGNFIMKNKNQIKKRLKSNKKIVKPIKIVYYDNIKQKFEELVNTIKSPILVLGRNNNDVNMILNNNLKLKDNILEYKKNKETILRYLTIHKSKGLEEENVIIINLINKINGIPNKIKEEKILKYISKKKEGYMYSEERRLFYVALTRTKNNVYLLVPKNNESEFIKEIKKYKKYVEIF